MKLKNGERRAQRPDPNRPPVHPGEVLREDVLPAIGEPVMTVAKKLGVTRQHLHQILAEKAPVTPGDGGAARQVLRQRAGSVAADAAGLRSLARRARAQEGGREDSDREGEGGVRQSASW